MKLKVCAVFDTKAKVYDNPFFVPHTAIATRGFMELCKKQDNPVGKYPEDFELHQIAEFENEKGLFTHSLSVLLAGKNCKENETTK